MADHLRSWNEGATKSAIVDFVERTAGAEVALDRARAGAWTVVSVKDDWATVFADAG